MDSETAASLMRSIVFDAPKPVQNKNIPARSMCRDVYGLDLSFNIAMILKKGFRNRMKQ